MCSGGNLWNNSTEPHVHLHRRRDDVRKQSVAAHDADAGLVATRFDSEHKRLEVALRFESQSHHDGVDVVWLVVALAQIDLLESEFHIKFLRNRVVCSHFEKHFAYSHAAALCNQSIHQFSAETL